MDELDMLKSRIAELRLDLTQGEIDKANLRHRLDELQQRYDSLVEQNTNQAARIQVLRRKNAEQGKLIAKMTSEETRDKD